MANIALQLRFDCVLAFDSVAQPPSAALLAALESPVRCAAFSRWYGVQSVRVGIVAVLLALPGDASADRTFPELKPEGGCAEGFSSHLQEGPDFYIWRCQLDDATPDARAVSGIYFGLHPSPSQPTSGVTRIPGVVAGKSVSWAQWRDGQMIRRETILSYQHSLEHIAIKLHVFLTARSHSELEKILEALTGVRFLERAPAG